eukprot:1100467_1
MASWFSSQWQTLQQFPMDGFSNMVLINDEECVIARFSSKSGGGDGIYKYNVNLFRWSLFIKYPFNFSSRKHTIAFDKKSNKILIYSYYSRFITVDIDTHQFEYFDIKELDAISTSCYKCGDKGHFATQCPDFRSNTEEQLISDKHLDKQRIIEAVETIVIDSHYHVFVDINTYASPVSANKSGHGKERWHLIFDAKDHTCEYTAVDLPSLSAICYLKSQDRLLLFGHGGEHHDVNTLLEFSWIEKQWIVVHTFNVATRIGSYGCVTTLGERYMMLFARAYVPPYDCNVSWCEGSSSFHVTMRYHQRRRHFRDSIFVLDLLKMSLRESKTGCPQKGLFSAVIMSNYKEKVLFIGYIKEMQKKHNVHFPNELKYVILSFFQCLYLHLLSHSNDTYVKSGKFWRIGFDDVISKI